jgi:transposase
MSDSNVRYVGLDVHKRVVEACLIDRDGAIVRRDRLAMSRSYLETYAREVLRPTDCVALEATTNTWAVVRVLKPHVAEIAVSNPLATKAIATSKIKTDKVDACVLAQLLRCDYLPKVWQPDEPTQELRRITAHRASLVGDRTRLKNRLHSVLAQRLIEPPCKDLFSVEGRAWLAELQLDAEGRLLLDSDLRLLAAVEQELLAIDKLIVERAYQESRVKLLMTLPGVSVTVATALLAAWGDIDRFTDPDEAAAYLGLVPSTHQSSDKCYHGPITKRGRSHARWMLVQAAHHVRNHPGPLGVFFRRLAKKKNYNVAVVATARKLAVIGWHMLKHNEPYRYAQPKPTETKLAKLRVQATGKRRATGPRKGIKSVAKLPGGSRTIKPLAQVCREENLPAPCELASGERRMLRETGAAQFAESLTVEHIVPRGSTKLTEVRRGRPAGGPAGRPAPLQTAKE